MSDTNSLSHKALLLLKEPRQYLPKIPGFLNSKFIPARRHFYEFFGAETYSKPYEGHDELLMHLGTRKNGFFIHVGGHDGFGADPTYYLERFLGWTGIIIEPLSVYKKCRRERPRAKVYNCAAVSKDHKGSEVTLIDCNNMSFLSETRSDATEWIKEAARFNKNPGQEIKVPARSIHAIYQEFTHNHPVTAIDLLAVDVEGGEIEVLGGLGPLRPEFILVETLDEQKRQRVTDLLEPLGYKNLGPVGIDDTLYQFNQGTGQSC